MRLYDKTRWGLYVVLQEYDRDDKKAKVKSIYIEPEHNISYQYHNYRQETWTVINGSGTIVVGYDMYEIKQGDTIIIPQGCNHAVKAGKNGLEFVEVQLGKYCEESDIERIFYEWDEIVEHVEGDNNE